MPSRAKTVTLSIGVLAALAMTVVAASGCGGDDNSNTTSTAEAVSSPETIQAAEKGAGQAALKSAARAEDQYLPGPIVPRVTCSEPVPPPAPQTPYQLRCHVEAFGTKPGSSTTVYMTSEDWGVPVDAEGKVGEAAIIGTARVRAFRRLDNLLNCTNHKVHPEKCIKPAPAGTPSDQALPSGENVPQSPQNP